MNSKELLQSFKAITDKMCGIIEKKNNDYASNTDAFSNFKFCSDFAGCSVEQVFSVFLAVKFARLKELLNGKEAKNESIEDTLIDLANYCVLYKIYRDENIQNQQKPCNNREAET